jgi:ATP-dependent Lhr-like helicase
VSTSALAWAHPDVAEWFEARFGSPTEPQLAGWPHILANHDALISAPTGSGKTLAAFLGCIDRLVRKAVDGTLGDRTEVLYISPLKALGNDIQKNLDGPLAEIVELARRHGAEVPEIRTAVRTGDTLMPARQAMLRKPPHILVTTPESLYILLTASRSREMLRSVETVIVDEIHAMADDKRGAHLALSLERLDALTGRAVPRIGLSATQNPIELVAEFLGGGRGPAPVIVQVPGRRHFDLAIEVPKSELGPIATHEQWEETYERLAELGLQHRSTLIFVNTRRSAERVTHHLAERLGQDQVAAHHGSLARRTRLLAEQRLKAGELRALVATASLELGIDIGHVDLVCQIGSPRSIATAVQRIGRAGHWRGAVPKARLFATTRDELIECAALVRAVRNGDLDRLAIPDAPLDILAQQIVAACAADDWDEEALFALVRRAHPYRDLPREDFDAIIAMLSDGIAARRGRYGAYLHHDQVNKRLRGRRGARLAAITGGGAIPDTALYTVVAEPEGTTVGTVDEDFAVESMAGDIMLLGNTSWRIRRISSGRVQVEDAHGASPTIPFWRGEAPARTIELSQHVAEVRARVSELVPGRESDRTPAFAWLESECGLDRAGAEQAVEYTVAGRTVLGAVPTQTTVIAERFFDEGGGMQLVIHAPFGARINKAWGLALRKRFCVSFNFELQAAATDDGLNISLAEQHSFPLADVFRFLSTASVQDVLQQAVLTSPIFGTRWRWDASRSLALLRFSQGRKVPLHIQRLRSDDLLASVFPDAAACQENIDGDIKIPDHPLIREVMKDVLTEAMDLDGLKDVLSGIAGGRITTVAVDTPVPSPFCHELLNANPFAYLDDAPLEERRARAVELRRVLPASVAEEVGKLDPAAIAQVTEDAWPDVRNADELHDALLTMIALPEDLAVRNPNRPTYESFFAELERDRRVGRATVGDRAYWFAAERAKAFEAITSDPGSQLTLVRGWMQHSGPVTAAELARYVPVSTEAIDAALLRLEAEGAVLRGHFKSSRNDAAAALEWCDRRLLARIHQLTLGRLRREIEPVTAAVFMRWLCEWQRIAPGSQAAGERGLLAVLSQLQGFEAPAIAWEPWILSRRVSQYDPAWLDALCLSGAVGWGRLSPHPATLEPVTADGPARRVIPTSVAPITFFVRAEADWLTPHGDRGEVAGLSRQGHAVHAHLRRAGASFFPDIVRATKLLKAEVETALWELVAAGLVTADGFDNLRALIDPRRRAGHGSGKQSRPRHSTGRWALVFGGEPADRTAAVEATCWMLLRRYGVVFRELLARETIVPVWRELLMAFRRLEDRGEIRGGRFVSSFIGEQFALPEAVESLRAMRRAQPTSATVTVAAADPLNLAGIIVPGDRVPAVSGRTVSFRDGVAVNDIARGYESDVVRRIG